MSGIDVIVEDLDFHPMCPHGPTILFSKTVNGTKTNFFACSACRDRKDCSFFLRQNEANKVSKAKKEAWEQERRKYLSNINHRKLFLALNEVLQLPEEKRMYCYTCNRFEFERFKHKHDDHNLINDISDYKINHPSEMLQPLDDNKKEAQFLFTKTAVKTLTQMIKSLNYKNVLCIGTPRIHEFIQTECPDMNSLLLDIDKRFHNFYGPLQFCWYNSFNHHFFFDSAKIVFEEFLQVNGGKDLILVTDPPFGGRIEPLAQTINVINNLYKNLNEVTKDLPIFWIFPYFMEPQILNYLPKFQMLDYKVGYDNHSLFQEGTKGRKQGSPVRIFTNLNPCLIKLPEEEGYKYCKFCRKWVAEENKHCNSCNSCTSKDGRTYTHCEICKRCVKPTWKHCAKCQRCTQVDHKCGTFKFTKECFCCKKTGHKQSECPDAKATKKRKLVGEKKNKKKVKCVQNK